MLTITICNHKGGTGKTTSAIHYAAALGLSGRRTLVIDLDPQGFLTRMLGLDEPDPAASSLMLFDPETSLRDIAVRSMEGFDLIPASSRLTKRIRHLNKPTDVLWTKESLEEAPDYDVVLFDTAAAVTVYSLNALVASQFAVIPVTPEYQPIVGAEQTYQTVTMVRRRLNPELHEPWFLFTQVDARKRIHHTYRTYLRDKYGERVMESVIRTSTSLSEAYGDGTTVFERESRGRGARDYANATDELLRNIREMQEDDAAYDNEPLTSASPPSPQPSQT